jgi:hypothetical protein
MSCILRIAGDSLDVDAMLKSCTLAADTTWKKGSLRGIGTKTHSTSGASFVASEAGFDQFKVQVAEATNFLREHAAAISTLVAFSGVDYATLDFGVSVYEDTFSKTCYLPPVLVGFAAVAGVGLEVSYYACSNGTEDER